MLVNAHLLNQKLMLLFSGIVFTTTLKAQDWSLKQCIDTALLYNKTLKLAQTDAVIFGSKNKEAKAGFIPKLYGNADYRYYSDLPYQLLPASVFNGPPGVYKEAQFGTPHNLNANLMLEVPLYNPQTAGAINITGKAKELNLVLYRQTEEQVVFDVSNLYYNAQLIASQISFIKNSLSNSNKLLANVQLLYEQQMARSTDVDKVKLQVSQLTTQLDKANSQYQQVLGWLKLQLGVAPAKPVTIEKMSGATLVLPKYNSQATPEVSLLNAKSLLLKSELNVLKLSHLPSISLYGSYGNTGYGSSSGVNDFFKTYPVGFAGVKMSWLLFSGTTLESKIFQKKEEIKQNDLRLELLNEKQLVQVSNAQMQFDIANSSLINCQSQLELAETIYSKMLLQHKEGLASLTDVLLSDNSQKEAQQNYLSALVDLMKADLELKKVTGNILPNK